MFVNRRHRK